MKASSVTNQMKAFWKYFPVELFITPCKVVDEII